MVRSKRSHKESYDAEKKNIVITTEEISILRKGVLDKFISVTGEKIDNPDKIFNSNLKNYQDLYDSINDTKRLAGSEGRLTSINITSNKPLVVLFYFSKHSIEGLQTFRKNFIELLYQYAFGISRDEFLSSVKRTSSPVSIKQLENIAGYWECFYDKNGDFAAQLQKHGKATLGKLAYWIDGDSMENATFQFYQSKSFGKGTVSVKGPNLFFKSENNSEEQYVVMNCGTNIEELPMPIEKIVGCFHHIDDAGSPKVGRCVMYRIMNSSWDWNNEKSRKEFTDAQEFSLYKAEKSKMLNDVKAYFFEKETNTLTANLNVYKEIIKNSKFAELKS